ncbi:MAG TPA: HDIG domain-containing protein [Prosthecobacter sp.]|nr:HDIG domain-containing protein [Prosthecobacter sp.]
MFESIRRAKLQRAGLSCGKTRRKHQEGDLVDELRTHPVATGIIYTLFFVGIGILMNLGASVIPGTVSPQPIAYLCAAAIGIALIVHLRIALQEDVADNAELALVFGVLLLHLGAHIAMLDLGNRRDWGGALLVTGLPHAFAPLVLSVVLGRRIGLVGAIYATLLGAWVCVAVNPLTYLATSSLIGFLVVVFTRHVRRRHRLFMAGLYIGGVAALFSFLLHEPWKADNLMLTRVIGIPFAVGVVTGMLVGGLVPVIETVFGVTTDVSWLELADLNHPLMKRLSIEAPGTYHHSLVVANLSEAAAEAIGASATMTRVCAYFHDIGKLTKPEYFIENMDPANNPHDDLTARMSALILIAHVKDGVDIAIKHKLNCRIIDVIEQHHGTSLAWYFYKRALDQQAEALRLVEAGKSKEDDVPQVSEEVFRYPGPRPQFKESAIISLADAVESASRALEKPNASRIESLVDDIVQSRMQDRQLDECDLTIAELAKVKNSFIKTLLSMMHSRIKYQKATEATSNVLLRDTPVPHASDGTTIIMESLHAQNEPAFSERKKRTTRKPPPASAA